MPEKKASKNPEAKPKPAKAPKAAVHKNVQEALFAFQNEAIVLPRSGNGKAASGKAYKYVTLDDLINQSRPMLAKHGLCFTQLIHGDKLETQLIHAPSNTALSSDIFLGSATGMQDYGSRITYARRYALTGLLGLSSEEDIDASTVTVTIANVGALADVAKGHQPAAAPAKKDVIAEETAKIGASKPAQIQRSENFLKAKTAIESAFSAEALEMIKGQIDRSQKLLAEEKTDLYEIVKARETEVAGTIH